MIITKRQLKKTLEIEKKLYPNNLFDYIVCYQRIYNWKYIKFLRKSEYYKNNSNLFLFRLLYLFYSRKRNKLGLKIGIEMWENTFQQGLTIHHSGNIVVNGGASVGKNCALHGDNCIGNNGKDSGLPVIGDNVKVGVGAKILGNVIIADDIKIGAGAVVVSSFFEKGITIVGIPARKVDK